MTSSETRHATATVRDAAFDVLRRRGLTTIFANPGSTEVPLLAGLPDDLGFVLALHEGSVVGMATGYAIGRGEPALALLHTTAGLGNAVGALATARVNRAPLVVLVGQQDRRHLALEPFLAGRLEGLAGDYPVWTNLPARPQDVPGAIERAFHEAVTGRGPALVVVPMDDWGAPAPVAGDAVAPDRLLRAAAADPARWTSWRRWWTSRAARLWWWAPAPTGRPRGRRSWRWPSGWARPVWQESFGARAGFPQDHPLFAGHLPAGRARLRAALDGHDVVLAVGAPVFRQYPYEPGPLVPEDAGGARHRRPGRGAPEPGGAGAAGAAGGCMCRARRAGARARRGAARPGATGPPEPPADGEPLRAGHVLAALAERLPADAVLVEETPSSRPELHARVPARQPLGFVSAAMGGLGFALPAAIGLRMARPDRPVVAVVGDGSSLYAIQALWSAAHYRVGALFVILANGGYAIMDRLAEQAGRPASASPAWPAGSSRASGPDCHRAGARLPGAAGGLVAHDELVRVFDETLPGLVRRAEPTLRGGGGGAGPDLPHWQ